MGETTTQIEDHIEDTRDQLGSNLDELERRMRSAADWKEYFRANPSTMVSVAFGGGVLLAALVGGRKHRHGASWNKPAAVSEPLLITNSEKLKALETWNNIKGALVGVAASRLTKFVSDIVPGFQEQLQHTQDAAKLPPQK